MNGLTEEESFPDDPYVLHFLLFVLVRGLNPGGFCDERFTQVVKGLVSDSLLYKTSERCTYELRQRARCLASSEPFYP